MRWSALLRCGNCLSKFRFDIPTHRKHVTMRSTLIRYAAETCDAFVCSECESTTAYLVSVDRLGESVAATAAALRQFEIAVVTPGSHAADRLRLFGLTVH